MLNDRKKKMRFGSALFTAAVSLACAGVGTPQTEEAPEATPTEEVTPVASPVAERSSTVRWAYNDERADAIGADRLEAPFDQLTAPCELSHEGTGGISRVWHPDEDCGMRRNGFLMKGEWRSICFGASPGEHPSWCDPQDASENERVDTLIPVTQKRGCTALFGEHPFTKVEGCSR